MVAVAIGVSDAENLQYLPAALNCAERFFKWSTALGYEAKIITDADKRNPVTVERLRKELDAILADTRPIHRMLIYFAGHGYIRELASGLWFLSDWKKEGVAVAYEALRRRLGSFGIDQIGIFSDACRSLPKSVFHLGLQESPVLAPGLIEDADPDLDKFLSTQDGKPSFAVSGSTEKDDVCVFSGVLLDALWGIKSEAFSKVVSDSITGSSLAQHLKAEVPRMAAKYGLRLKPSVSAAFPEGDNIYLSVGALPAGSVPPFDWPAPPGPPPSGPQPSLAESEPVELLQELRCEIRVREARPPKPRGGRAAPGKLASTRKRSARPLLERLRRQKLPRGFETGSGFAVEGAEIRRLWTPNRVFTEPHLDANWWRVRESISSRLNDPAPILIEFMHGQFAAAAALPGFVAGLVCDSRGVSAVVYRPSNSDTGARKTEDVIGALELGALRADEVTDLAARIRTEKHVDPMLGVFAAYLYDSIGDVGSIRRMAYFYVQNQQPIPYDIAILAQIRGQQQGDRLVARVPRVAAREPRSDAERQYWWTYEETSACEGVVGGAWPWLRQGWAFLADPTGLESTLMRPGLTGLTKHLARSRFPTFDSAGGLELANLFDLVPREPLIQFDRRLDPVTR